MTKRDRDALLRHLDEALASNPGSPYCSPYITRRLTQVLRDHLAAEAQPET